MAKKRQATNDGIVLEARVTHLKGNPRRCQAVRKGKQCNNIAREGYEVCFKHGAGSAKREKEGTKKPPGGQIVHGLYAKRYKQTLLELKASGVIDEHYKAHHIEEEIGMSRLAAEKLIGHEPDFMLLLEKLAGIRDNPASDVDDIIEAAKLAWKLQHFYELVIEQLGNVSSMVLKAAQIDNITSTTKARELFVDLLVEFSAIARNHLTYDLHMALAAELQAKFDPMLKDRGKTLVLED
jgi:hypothetical protein